MREPLGNKGFFIGRCAVRVNAAQFGRSLRRFFSRSILDVRRQDLQVVFLRNVGSVANQAAVTEGDLDAQMRSLFDKLRVEDAEFRDTFREQLRKATNWELGRSSQEDSELKKRHTEVVRQQGQLLNLRLLEEIDADTFAAKAQELRDEEAGLRLQIEGASRNRNETIDIAIKAFELSQNLRAKWLADDWAAKRRILEIVCLNWKLDGVNLVPEWRKPFDLLAEGLLQKDSRAGGI